LVLGADRVARLTPQPLFRWSHPVGTTVDAALFVWMDGDQPVTLGSIVMHRELGHYCELQSVTAQSLKAVKLGTTVWEPAMTGWKATGTCDEKLVWSKPRLDLTNDPRHSYIRLLGPQPLEKKATRSQETTK